MNPAVNWACHGRRDRCLAVVLIVIAFAVSAQAQPARESRERRDAFLSSVSLTTSAGNDGLRDDSRISVLVRFRTGRVREISTPVVGSDARHAEIHYDTLGVTPPAFDVGPVSAIDSIGLRFRQGRGGGLRGSDNFTMSRLSITLVGRSRSFVWTVSVASDVGHRFERDEDYFPGTLSVAAAPIECTQDADCNDGLFCTGLERCVPGDKAADPRGCVFPTAPPCPAQGFCSELRGACLPPYCEQPDRDGDGLEATVCGGGDCDDDDGGRFPGNPEVCDKDGHDEDCDPATIGAQDRDGDGFVGNACCYRSDDNQVYRCGPDCDDLAAHVVPGAQTCGPQGSVLVCTTSGAFVVGSCGQGLSCVGQPNGLGICLPDVCPCP